MTNGSSNREHINGTPEFYKARAVAFALIGILEAQEDETFQPALVQARASQVVRDVLEAQGRMSLLSPCFDIDDEVIEEDGGYEYTRRYYSDELGGIVKITVNSYSDWEGSSYERTTTLNGVLHDIEGPAMTVRRYHNIPEEKYLDEDYAERYSHGEVIESIEDTAALRGRLTDGEARYFGWADEGALAAA